MKRHTTRSVLVLAAAAVVVAVNAWTLIAARHNRSDPNGGTVELTEREVRLAQVPWESTVTVLELSWDVLSDTPGRRDPPAWLDATKLAELGFDCTMPVGGPSDLDGPPELAFADETVLCRTTLESPAGSRTRETPSESLPQSSIESTRAAVAENPS